MPRLDPVDKLPLSARKNLRDEWESKRGELETQLLDTMGQAWTIEVNPLFLYAYSKDGSWAKESPGAMIYEYFKEACRGIRSFVERNGDNVRDELSRVCTAKVLTIDYDDEKKDGGHRAKVSADGKLVILFHEDNFCSNISDNFSATNLERAINEASSGEEVLSFKARKSIRNDFEPKVEDLQKRLTEIIGKEITIVPNFETTFTKLKAAIPQRTYLSDFDEYIGNFVQLYFNGFVRYLERKEVSSDEMVREALAEQMEKGEVHFRIVDSIMTYSGEAAFEDGILYLQTSTQKYGKNIDDVAVNLMDIL